MTQPQKRRYATPHNPATRAALAQKARQQHATKRGYAIDPERRDEYHRAYLRLLNRGVSRADILEELRPIYEEK